MHLEERWTPTGAHLHPIVQVGIPYVKQWVQILFVGKGPTVLPAFSLVSEVKGQGETLTDPQGSQLAKSKGLLAVQWWCLCTLKGSVVISNVFVLGRTVNYGQVPC